MTSFNKTNTLANYEEGNTYTFTLFIKDIRESDVTPGNTNIWSHETELDTEVTLGDILSDAEAGGTRHVHKTVIVTGIVIWKSDDGESIVMSPDGNVKDTAFFVTRRTGFDDTYQIGSSHTVRTFIEGITKSENDPTKTNIWTIFLQDV